ncbi:MAG TPA: HlyD family efflux transporter periplasmic adaptor subunit [Isosphaeraceae bacterium]|nr:HlyD family efflux transporter periplasmic adaptor subunit [Isosphaeraceae bacterium]
MAEETYDQGLLEQTKNQIRKLVAEIAELAESDIQPQDFHVEFLNRVVAAVAASGGALWLLDGRGSLKLQHHLEFQLSGLLDGRVRTQPHDALLGCMIQASQPQIIPPGAAVEGVPNAGNPTGFALILAPLFVDKQVVGLVEILMDPTRRAASQKSTLRFVSDLCDLAGQYLKNRQTRQMLSQQRLWNQLEQFSQTIHSSLDLKETAYAVANDGKRLVGCDRLSVALKYGGRAMVEAVSGQEVVEQRANLIRDLTRLCKAVIRSGDDLVYTGNTEGFDPDLRDALETYVDESGSKAVVITLLHKPDEEPGKDKHPFGCVVAEQIGDEMAATDMQARTEVVSRHASTALWNAHEHDRIFLRPVLKAIGTPTRFFKGRTLAKIAAVLVAILALIGIMAFVPWQLTIEGKGSLMPQERRKTHAPVAGIVGEVLVDHGQAVKKGDVLVKLTSHDLDKDLEKLRAERDAAASQVGTLLARRSKATYKPDDQTELLGQMREAEIRRDGAKKQIELIEEQKRLMTVTAPVDGIVTTWEPRKALLGRPVEIGAELVEIASTEGDWVLEVEVPDDDMGPVLDAQSTLEDELRAARAKGVEPKRTALDAYFITMTDTQHRYPGHVLRIASRAETVEGKHNNKVKIGFDDSVRRDYQARNPGHDFRTGAEVRARIQCGEARLAYVLLRDVINVYYEVILFRWPFLR